jgi:hypothetical protein
VRLLVAVITVQTAVRRLREVTGGARATSGGASLKA